MDYEIVVLSADALFARMLELEFLGLQISTLATSELQNGDRADVVILDLDSASAPSSDQFRRMIGFSSHPAMTSPDARCCSMILRRPFQMSLLRREALVQLDRKWTGSAEIPFRRVAPERRQIKLDQEASKLFEFYALDWFKYIGNTSFINVSDRICLKIMWADNLCLGRLGNLLLLKMFISHLFYGIVLFN